MAHTSSVLYSILQYIIKTKCDEPQNIFLYEHFYVHLQPLASPLASSFIAMFTDDSDLLAKFIRTNAPGIENDIVDHFHHTKDVVLT